MAPSTSSDTTSQGAVRPPYGDDDFATLWRDALDDFRKSTGEDIRDQSSPLYMSLQGCSDYAAVVGTLEAEAQAFKAYRRGSPNALKMRAALRPFVRAVLNMMDTGAEGAASKAVPGGKAIFVAVAVLLRAVQGVSARFDALVALLEKFGYFLARLDVRVSAPSGPSTRALLVDTLVEMLRALACATHMMRQNRAKHFLDVLISRADDITDLTRRTENLMKEETRLSLAEVHSRIHGLSEALVFTSSSIESGISELNEKMSTVHLSANQVSAHMQEARRRLDDSGIYEMPRRLETFIDRYENRIDSRSDPIEEHSIATFRNDITVHTTLISSRLDSIETEMRSQRTLQLKMLGRPQETLTAHKWVSQVTLPCVDMPSFARLAVETVACFRDLSPEEQAVLKQGIVALYAVAAVTVSGASSENTVEILLAGILNPGAVLSGFLPMAAAFLGVFAFWRRFVSRTQLAIHRPPGHALSDSIILIDVFGTHYLLQPERCKTWGDLHDFLLDQYEGKNAVEFIRSHAYRIMDLHEGESFVKPQDWAFVQTGITLELSFAVRQTSDVPMCLWCGASAVIGDPGWVQCHACTRRFWASNDSVGSVKEPARTITTESVLSPSSGSDYVSESSNSDLGVESYRRVVVVYSNRIDQADKALNSPHSRGRQLMQQQLLQELAHDPTIGTVGRPKESMSSPPTLNLNTNNLQMFNSPPAAILSPLSSIGSSPEDSFTGADVSFPPHNRARSNSDLPQSPSVMATSTPIPHFVKPISRPSSLFIWAEGMGYVTVPLMHLLSLPTRMAVRIALTASLSDDKETDLTTTTFKVVLKLTGSYNRNAYCLSRVITNGEIEGEQRLSFRSFPGYITAPMFTLNDTPLAERRWRADPGAVCTYLAQHVFIDGQEALVVFYDFTRSSDSAPTALARQVTWREPTATHGDDYNIFISQIGAPVSRTYANVATIPPPIVSPVSMDVPIYRDRIQRSLNDTEDMLPQPVAAERANGVEVASALLDVLQPGDLWPVDEDFKWEPSDEDPEQWLTSPASSSPTMSGEPFSGIFSDYDHELAPLED